MDKGQEISVRERLHRSPVGARLALWFVISACGLVIVLQLMFAVIEVARPFNRSARVMAPRPRPSGASQ